MHGGAGTSTSDDHRRYGYNRAMLQPSMEVLQAATTELRPLAVL